MAPGVAVTHATLGPSEFDSQLAHFEVCGVTAAHRIFTPRGKSSSLFRPTTIGFCSIGRTPDSESGNGSSTLSIRTAADCCTCESTVSQWNDSDTVQTGRDNRIRHPRERQQRDASPRHCLRSSNAEQPVLTRKCVGSSPTGGTVGPRSTKVVQWPRKPKASVRFRPRARCACSSVGECRPDVPEIAGSIPATRTTRQATHLAVRSVSYAERAGFDPLACYDTASNSPGGDRSLTCCVCRVRFPGSLRHVPLAQSAVHSPDKRTTKVRALHGARDAIKVTVDRHARLVCERARFDSE